MPRPPAGPATPPAPLRNACGGATPAATSSCDRARGLPRPGGGRRARHHGARRLSPGQGRLPRDHSGDRPRRAPRRPRGAPRSGRARSHAARRVGLRRARRAAAPRRDERHRRHRPHPRKEPPDRIKGLELGADDYLPKPFSPQELVLRVGAVLRRLAAPAVAAGGLLVAGPITLDRTGHRVTVDGAEIELTDTEFRLLRTLIEREGRVQSRAQLLETVWHAQPDILTRTVDMHVQRLRQKLGPAAACIETVRGAGYRFRRPDARARARP